MRLLTLAPVLVLALVLALVASAGCGGDDETSGDGDTVTLETTTDETTTDETTTDETTTDDTTGGSLASGDCEELISASAALGRAFSTVEGEDDFEESSEAFSRFADEAPDEIRADLELMAETYEEYADAIADIGLEPGETPSAEQAVEFQQALAGIDLAEFTAASQRFTTWAATNC